MNGNNNVNNQPNGIVPGQGQSNVAGNPQVNSGQVQQVVAGQGQQTAPQPSNGGGTSGVNAVQIVCDKCGTSYSSSQRYCMKCGNLNYSHPSNQSMKQYLNYDVVNQSYVNNGNAKLSHNSVDPYLAEKRGCLIGNIVIHIILIALSVGLTYYASKALYIYTLVATVITVGITFIYNYSGSLIFVKAREPWWFYYIPIFNTYTMFKIAFGNGGMFLLLLVPGVNIIILFVYLYKLAERFNHNKLLTILFPYVMLPIIGFSNNDEYAGSGSLKNMEISLGDDEFDKKGRTKSEADYAKKHGATIFGILLVVGILVVLLFPYIKEYGGDLLQFFVDKYNEFVEFISEMN